MATRRRLLFSHCFHLIKMIEKLIKERMKDLVHPLLRKVINKRRGKKKKKNRVCKACTFARIQ